MYIVNIGSIIGGFLLNKGEESDSLQDTGLLLKEHEEHATQKADYEEWVRKSLEEHGKLDLPSELIDENLLPEEPKDHLKVTRAVDLMRKEIEEEERVKILTMNSEATKRQMI